MTEVREYCSAGPLSKDDVTELHHRLLVQLACDISGSKYKRGLPSCGGSFHLEEEDSGRSKAAWEQRACYGVTIKNKQTKTNPFTCTRVLYLGCYPHWATDTWTEKSYSSMKRRKKEMFFILF